MLLFWLEEASGLYICGPMRDDDRGEQLPWQPQLLEQMSHEWTACAASCRVHGSLPHVSGLWARVPRPQHVCMRFAQQAIGDERHLVFECPALQSIRDGFPGLFGADHAAIRVVVGHCSCCTFFVGVFYYLNAASPSNRP
jgi:hypothetical protein